SAHSSRLCRMELRNRMVVETVGSARRVSEPARIRSVLARGRAGGLRGLIPRILQRNTDAYNGILRWGSGTVEEHFTRVPPFERIDYKRSDIREASLGGGVSSPARRCRSRREPSASPPCRTRTPPSAPL